MPSLKYRNLPDPRPGFRQDLILELEAQVIDLQDALKSMPKTDGVPRDNLGTLHVNLCELIRQATKVKLALESKHAFTSTPPIKAREIK
jgi:hypothetical protein